MTAIAVSDRAKANGSLVATDSVTDLLRIAVEKGTNVEQLEKLVDLHERMEARAAAREFFRAFAAFQADCPSITRNREGKVVTSKGGTYSFTYADLDETVMTVKPIAAKYGLSFGWDHEVTKDSLTSVFTLRHEAGHSVASRYTLPIDNPSGMSPQQKVGAAQTFADRRSLMSGLGLTSSDEDAEGQTVVDPTPISDEEVQTLADLLADTGASEKKFLDWLGAPSLAEIRVVDYTRAVAALKAKQEAAK